MLKRIVCLASWIFFCQEEDYCTKIDKELLRSQSRDSLSTKSTDKEGKKTWRIEETDNKQIFSNTKYNGSKKRFQWREKQSQVQRHLKKELHLCLDFVTKQSHSQVYLFLILRHLDDLPSPLFLLPHDCHFSPSTMKWKGLRSLYIHQREEGGGRETETQVRTWMTWGMNSNDVNVWCWHKISFKSFSLAWKQL